MGSVFISYRREDSQGEARALFQDLVATLGEHAVFMDVDSIGLGRDFREVLQERLATCELMLVLIGRDWLESKDGSGRRRLDLPGDFVRLEIAAALKRNIPITPLLVQGAPMPTADQLPEGIRDLAYRNGFEISHNRWNSDIRELLKRLAVAPDTDAPTVVAGAARAATLAGKPRLAMVAGGIAALAVAAGAFFFVRSGDSVLETAGSEAGPATKTEPALSVELSKTADRTHAFEAADSQLSIGTPGTYVSSPFTVQALDPGKDFRIDFELTSTRSGGSTRYGIAWNYSPDDFMLFTLHSTGGGSFSIGPGRSRTLPPFSRLAQGAVHIRAESGFDTLRLTKSGSTLVFAVNGQDVWSTTEQRLSSARFAFWAADLSTASIRSYTLRQ